MKGVAALLLPGNMCDARMWRSGGDVIRSSLDRRLGRFPIDVDCTQDSSIEAMARRALAACEGPILPIGFSMGAIVALEMAILAPERVQGLVLAGYNAGADLPERAALRPGQQREVMAGGLERVVIDQLKPNYLGAANQDNQALRTLMLDMARNLGGEVFVRQSEALRRREDRVAALGEIRGPVLFLGGAEDCLCPPHWHERWCSLTLMGRFVQIEQAGHMAPLEQPDAFADAIDCWITQNSERLAA